MKFQTTINVNNLCCALLLAAGAASLVGCDASTTTPATGTGGSTVSVSGGSGSGGKVSATGGATPATGGAISATGGATPGTGGAIPATGGAIPATGGATPSTGGSTPGTGGSIPTTGGATPGTGGAGKGGGAAGADGGVGGTGGKSDASASGGAGGLSDSGVGTGGSGPLPDGAPVDPSKKITVWLVGDSTMQNCSGTGQCGWAAEFQQYLGPNATASNQARGGRSIQTWIWGDPNVSKSEPTPPIAQGGECQVIDKTTYSDNWTTMLDATKGMKAGDWVYIAFGINDGTGTCNRHVGSALYESDLAYLATEIRAKGANPIFGTPTSGQKCSGSTNAPNRGFGPETMAASTANNVPVVDLTTLSVALYNSLKLCPNGSTTFWFDGTHFKTDGATQVAGVVAKAIKDQGIGLAAYLK
jgi:lysophospholipase L1-like esterase